MLPDEIIAGYGRDNAAGRESMQQYISYFPAAIISDEMRQDATVYNQFLAIVKHGGFMSLLTLTLLTLTSGSIVSAYPIRHV